MQIDLKQLQPGETFELKHAYICDKPKSNFKTKSEEKEKSKNRTYSEKSKVLARLNVDMTNTTLE